MITATGTGLMFTDLVGREDVKQALNVIDSDKFAAHEKEYLVEELNRAYRRESQFWSWVRQELIRRDELRK